MSMQVTQKARVVAACLAALGGCGVTDSEPAAPDQRSSSVSTPDCSRWKFLADPPTAMALFGSLTRSDCKPDQCGLNGMWFGQGVKFRELHLGGGENADHFLLREVIPPYFLGKHDLALGIYKDQLFIKDRWSSDILVAGTAMRGATIVVESTVETVPTSPAIYIPLRIYINISDVRVQDYWDCLPGDTGCDQGYRYQFTATTNDGGCEVELCNPRLADDLPEIPNTWGTAVVFGGDVYDDDSYKVRSTSASAICPSDQLRAQDADVINFACIGTAISKLHLMRHTAAAMPSAKTVTVSQRQAMLRMITADYCGIGHSFTENGTRIRFDARGWPGFDGYTVDRSRDLEAVWTNYGASCIYEPRLASRLEIDALCKHPPPQCTAAHPDPSLLGPPPPPPVSGICEDFNSGNYLVTGLAL